jgi:RNA polymerase sigma-70 factor (ECF subfamily)
MQTIGPSDTMLIERFKKGDKTAMSALMDRHRPRAYAYAMRLSHDRDFAADVVADTFIRVNRSAASFRGKSAFSTWLHILTKNCYLDLRKKALLRVTESFSQTYLTDEGNFERQFESAGPSPHESAEEKARSILLINAVEKLPLKQKTLILMFHMEMLAYEEIAERLQIPVGTIKSRLHRARLVLRNALESDRYLLGVDAPCAA